MDHARLMAILEAGGLTLPDGARAEVTGADPVLPTAFAIGEAAAAALIACGAAATGLLQGQQPVTADVRAAAASLLGFAIQRLDGQPTLRPSEGLATVALYPCMDGRWIHLHGGFPHLKAGTLDLLGCDDDVTSVGAAVKRWRAQDLEDALAARGLCGAMVRSADEWAAHPQGAAVTSRPLVEITRIGDAPPEIVPRATRPLGGVRVLDLTRVLAGPACGRTLAEHGADVLLVNSPSLPNIAPFVMDTGHGKRSAHIDLSTTDGAETLRGLAAGADVFCQGYRSGSLARRGFGPDDLAALRPGIIYVSINCYGHEGPWATRAGWEQLAQSVTGIAAENGAPERPRLLPAAACDYTTGYLAAYGVITALAQREREGGSWHVRVSLCRTAMWLQTIGATCDAGAAVGLGDPSDLMTETETPYGRLAYLRPVVQMPRTPPHWTRPTVPLGSDAAVWGGGD